MKTNIKISDLPEVSLTKRKYGANIFLGISSDKKENIERFFLFLHNYGAAPEGSELEWPDENNENFARLQLTETKLIKGYNTYLFLINKYNHKYNTKKSEEIARREAREIVKNIRDDEFLCGKSHRFNKNESVIGSSLVKKNGSVIKI